MLNRRWCVFLWIRGVMDVYCGENLCLCLLVSAIGHGYGRCLCVYVLVTFLMMLILDDAGSTIFSREN